MTKSPLTLGYIRAAYIEGRTPYLRDTNPQLTAEEAKKQALEEFEGHADGCYIPKRTLERLGLLELATATKDREAEGNSCTRWDELQDDLNPSNSMGLDERGATNE